MPRFCWLLAVAIFAAVTAATSRADEPLRVVIDREMNTSWKAKNATPAAKSTDAEFLRRVYIDIIGQPPTYEETTKFLADKDEKKREKLIDALLARPEFATAQANV